MARQKVQLSGADQQMVEFTDKSCVFRKFPPAELFEDLVVHPKLQCVRGDGSGVVASQESRLHRQISEDLRAHSLRGIHPKRPRLLGQRANTENCTPKNELDATCAPVLRSRHRVGDRKRDGMPRKPAIDSFLFFFVQRSP